MMFIQKSWMVVLPVFFAPLITFNAAQAATPACGVFRVVKGQVRYAERAGQRPSATAAINKKICSGGQVITSPDSRAVVIMPGEQDELFINPATHVMIQELKRDADGKQKRVLLNLIYGKIRSNVQKDAYDNTPDNQYRVRTKTAVAGVRGTQFLTSFDASNNQSEIVTFRGAVEVGRPIGAGFDFSNSVQVIQGQRTTVMVATPPAAPTAVPAQEMKLLNETTQPESPQKSTSPSNLETHGSKDLENKKSNLADKDAKTSTGPKTIEPKTPERGVASVAPQPSLVTPEDITLQPKMAPSTIGLVPSLQVNPLLPVGAAPCNFCNEQIVKKGEAKVIIDIKPPTR